MDYDKIYMASEKYWQINGDVMDKNNLTDLENTILLRLHYYINLNEKQFIYMFYIRIFK